MADAGKKIVDAIIEAGIDHVFTLPGGGTTTAYIFSALYDAQDKITTVLTRNEQTASCMAEMYGRLTGKPGLLIGQGPFVGSAGLFGMMEGYLTSTPMVVLADVTEYGDLALHAPFQCGTGDYGTLDLKKIFEGTAKFVTLSTSPLEAVRGVQLAIKHAISGRPGPCVCLFRVPALRGELTDDKAARIFPTAGYLKTEKPAAFPGDVEKTADALLNASRPVIIAGNGVHASRAYDALKKLAEVGGFPVATSYQGKSAIPETHPLGVGVMNMYGETTALKTISDADLILIVGCRMKPQDTCFESQELIDPGKQKIIQVDIDPRNAGWVYPVNIGLTGDAKLVMEQLTGAVGERLNEKINSARDSRIKAIQALKQKEGYFDDSSLYSSQKPILSTRVVKELRDALPGDSLITLDGGNNRVAMLRYFLTKQPGTCFAASGIGAMSLSVPSAIAAKMLYPERACVAVCGDGGMAMQIHALSTAKQYGAAAIFVVMNDSVLGAVRDGQKQRRIASEFIDTEFARIAEAFGCRGVRVTNPEDIAPAIKQALESKEPFVIDILTEPDEHIRDNVRSEWARQGLANI